MKNQKILCKIVEDAITNAFSKAILSKYKKFCQEKMQQEAEAQIEFEYAKKSLDEDRNAFIKKNLIPAIESRDILFNESDIIPLTQKGIDILKIVEEFINSTEKEKEECYPDIYDTNIVDNRFDHTLYVTRSNYPIIFQEVISHQEGPSIDEASQSFTENLTQEASKLKDSNESKKLLKSGYLFLDAIISNDLNHYDSAIDEILI